MNELVFKSDKGNPVTTSLLVAEKFGKNHRDVLASIDELIAGVAEKSADLFYETEYIHPQNKQAYRVYIMTRDGFSLLVMGFTGKKALKFKLEYIDAFNRMEEIIKRSTIIDFSNPDTVLQLVQNWKEEQVRRLEAEKIIEEQKPAVIFTKAVTGSNTNILMRDLAKLICQNGIDIGEARLFDWMVDNGFLIRNSRWSNKKQTYRYYYMPTQRAADLKVFFVTEQVISVGESSFVKHTVKITPKGQVYFINKLIKDQEAA